MNWTAGGTTRLAGVFVAATLLASCGGAEAERSSPAVESAPFETVEYLPYTPPTYEEAAPYSVEESVDPVEGDDEQLWADHEGDAWQAFADAYEEGWQAGCEAVFEQSPDSYLYYDDVQYSDVDCPSADDAADDVDTPTFAPADPTDEGETLGRAAGCHALFESTAVPSLNWGEDSYIVAGCDGI